MIPAPGRRSINIQFFACRRVTVREELRSGDLALPAGARPPRRDVLPIITTPSPPAAQAPARLRHFWVGGPVRRAAVGGVRGSGDRKAIRTGVHVATPRASGAQWRKGKENLPCPPGYPALVAVTFAITLCYGQARAADNSLHGIFHDLEMPARTARMAGTSPARAARIEESMGSRDVAMLSSRWPRQAQTRWRTCSKMSSSGKIGLYPSSVTKRNVWSNRCGWSGM